MKVLIILLGGLLLVGWKAPTSNSYSIPKHNYRRDADVQKSMFGLNWKTPKGWQEIVPGKNNKLLFQADAATCRVFQSASKLNDINRYYVQLGRRKINYRQVKRLSKQVMLKDQRFEFIDIRSPSRYRRKRCVIAVRESRQGTWMFVLIGPVKDVTKHYRRFRSLVQNSNV